ncbi:hypothetical protein BU23DRAFT_545830 [Bimuria novae-zelandiae CBS 107.79]|uniref:Large ribosomal subunit protein uL23m n=1 Tax=Bimuria novae-zelandiae CBS 107.79 TaxID=1447943 RepID=A0A6A5UMB8_9PLEO|nr:hypothetical protein BU23DRAFT_545830 [Bimuria novae-zelandiae CBS 107.79]
MELPPVTKKIVAFGSKQVFLPKFTIALIRTPRLSPYHAKFRVPLNFSKFDLRDYLFHAYNVRVHSVRSLVKQLPVRDTTAQPRHWFRPESEKYMTVELERPFVWPEDPSDWTPWGNEEKRQNTRQSLQAQGVRDAENQREEARELRRQAVRVLQGKGPREVGGEKVKEKEAEMAREEAERIAEMAVKENEDEETEAKRLEEAALKEWEAKRTPQIFGNELLDTENFASLRVTKPKEEEEAQ